MRGLWVFPTIFCLLIVFVLLEEFRLEVNVLLIIWFIRLVSLKKGKVLIVSLVSGVVMTGIVLWKNNDSQTQLDPEQTEFSIIVQATTFQIDGDRIQFYGEIKNETFSEEVVVRYTIDSETEKHRWIENGIPQVVFVEGKLTKPSESRNFHQFNYRQYLQRLGITWTLNAETLTIDESETLTAPLNKKIDYIRQTLLDNLDERLEGSVSHYVKAMLFADRRSLSEEVIQQYRSIGIIHLLSISGLHIQFLISRCKSFFLRLGITRETTSLLLLIILPIYGFLTGWGISIFRAIVQYMLSLAFFLLNKRSHSLDNWSLTMLMALVIHPASIYTVGFQLSYFLSGLLIILTKQKWMQQLSKAKASIFLSLMISITSVPILTFHFYEFPWIAVLANVVFVPFFSWVFLPMLVFLFVLSWPLNGTYLFTILMQRANQLIHYVEIFVAYTTERHQFSFITGRLSFIGMGLLFIGLWLIIHGIEKKTKKILYIFSGISFFMLGLYSERFSPVGKVILLDVGQGESILIKEPYNRGNTLIDTGGQVRWKEIDEWREQESPFSLGKDIVVPSIKAQGVNRIDRIYLTHADEDHIGALTDIVNEIKVIEIASTKQTFSNQYMKEKLPILYENNVELITLSAPEALSSPGSDFILLHPIDVSDGKNDDSLVLYGTLGEYTWLFTGDLEEKGENELIRTFPGLTADILNVAHHGSNTSTHYPILNHLEPEIAWISSGENNVYGHPHPDVIERLTESRIAIYRTDEQGAVLYQYSTISILDNWLPEINIHMMTEKEE